jgi:oligosaccharide repeat unit polymerase
VVEIVFKLLAIMLSILLFAQAYLIRRVVGTYIFPAALLSLAWFFFTFIPLVVLFFVPINPLSVLYIFVCVSAFSISALPFNWPRAFKANKLKTYNLHMQFNSRLMYHLFYISSISAIVLSTICVISSGIDLRSVIFNIVETSGYYASVRGKGETEYGIWGVLGIFFTYSTSILGGLISQQYQRGKKKWTIPFITFAPSIYVMITQSAKLILYYSISCYFAAVLLKKIYSNKLDLFNWAFLLKLIGFALLMLPLLTVSFLSRNLNYELDLKDMLSALLPLINSYMFGQIYAFSDFFSFYLGAKSQLTYIHDLNSYGYWTFKSIFDMLGGDKYFPPTFFQDSYYYKEVVATNIFTIFRSLINDFGSVGAIFFMFASGFVAHALFYLLLRARRAWVACSAFLLAVIFIIGTYLLSIFVARWSLLLFVAFTIIFGVNNRYCKNQNIKINL